MTPRKANHPSLSGDQIVQAALELIDETGLDGHNMRALAQRLGVDASTIYYYVPSKASLFTLIVDQIMSAVDLSQDDPAQPPAQRLLAAAHEYRRVLMLHPRALGLVAARSLRSPTQLQAVEAMLGILFDAGFSPLEALTALDAIGQTVIGMSVIHAAHADAEQEPFAPEPAERFPNVRRLIEEGRYLGAEAEFEATIRALIAGLLARQADGSLLSTNAPQVRLAPPTLKEQDAQDTH